MVRELAQLAAAWKNGTFAPATSVPPRDVLPRRPPPEPPPALAEETHYSSYKPLVGSYNLPDHILNNVSVHVLNLINRHAGTTLLCLPTDGGSIWSVFMGTGKRPLVANNRLASIACR